MIFDKIIADRISTEINAGYWYIDNKYFFNKAECLRYATKIQKFDVKFDFFNNFYKSINWGVESPHSLEYIYGQRAQQIRDKYDYVMVAFTGGSDSNNVIDSFLNNNIRIDEIVSLYPIEVINKLLPTFNKTDDSAANLMFEYTEAAAPKLAKIAKTHPNIKISVIDYSTQAIDIISTGNLPKIILGGIGASPSLTGHYMLGEKMRSYEHKGKVTCVAGIDKPRIQYNTFTKQYNIYFSDISVVWGKHSDIAYNGYQPNIEYFYYSIDMPEVIKKQCSVVKRVMTPIINAPVRPDFYRNIHKKIGRIEAFTMDNSFYKSILYKGWDTSIFQAGKPSGYFYQESAEWFYKSALTDQRTKDYHNGQIRELIDGIDNRFIVFDAVGRPLKFLDTYSTPIVI